MKSYKKYNIQANEMLTKLKGKWLAIQFGVFSIWSFFHFLYTNIPDTKCHKQKWQKLFFTGIKLEARAGMIQFLATESFLKMMKNALYFTLNALFVLTIFKFCIDFLVIYTNGLIKKIRLISNFMTSQPG